MSAAAAFLDALRTPAYRGALDLLMARGSWVARAEFDALGFLPTATENALADLVMLGQATYTRAAGYRLAQAPVVRAAARGLMERPGEARYSQMLQVADGLHVGVALRRGDGEVLLAGLVVPNPDGAAPDVCVDHGGVVLARVWNAMEVAHG